MSKYSFIVNPRAGHGKGQEVFRYLKTELANRRIPAEIVLTTRAGHATEIARKSFSQTIVAVGGDGTLNEVANGLIGSSKTLGVLPGGSGNDFIKSIGIPTDVKVAFAKLLEDKVKLIDVATVACSPSTGGSKGKRYFVNGVGIGFDAEVANRTAKVNMLSGIALYAMAVFQTLGKYKSPNFKITLDSEYSESCKLLIAIGNGRCAGGGFYLTPQAEIDDGLLDVCMIDNISIPKILMIMPKVIRGRHLSSESVRMSRVMKIHVEANETFFVHADGEIVGSDVNSVDVDIVAKGLSIVTG